MFAQLSHFEHILVSGPQRSGTRFCSKIIATDLGYRYVDEADIGYHNISRVYENLRGSSCVIHCPALGHALHRIVDGDICVVFMLRRPADIRKSMKRIGWDYGQPERDKYVAEGFTCDQGDIVDLKYAAWEQQKENIANFQEIEYESLSAHPRWIPQERRLHFGAHQTED